MIQTQGWITVLHVIASQNLEARIRHAARKAERVADFLKSFPPIPQAQDAPDHLPPISWRQIERQLLSLAGEDFDRAQWEIEILKASAKTSPPELVFRDLFCLAWSLVDGAKTPTTAQEASMD